MEFTEADASSAVSQYPVHSAHPRCCARCASPRAARRRNRRGRPSWRARRVSVRRHADGGSGACRVRERGQRGAARWGGGALHAHKEEQRAAVLPSARSPMFANTPVVVPATFRAAARSTGCMDINSSQSSQFPNGTLGKARRPGSNSKCFDLYVLLPLPLLCRASPWEKRQRARTGRGPDLGVSPWHPAVHFLGEAADKSKSAKIRRNGIILAHSCR
eukprot:gene11099-biopygen7824